MNYFNALAENASSCWQSKFYWVRFYKFDDAIYLSIRNNLFHVRDT